MRGLGIGLAMVGAAALGAALGAGGTAAHAARILGAVALGGGLLVLLGDAGLRLVLRRTGLRAQHLSALRGALQRGTDQALAAVERLRAAGLDGSATIVGVTDTGSSFNKRAEVDLELEIRIDGREPYRVRQRHLVPQKSTERLRVGATLKVKVDPEIAERLLIDWQTA